MIMQRSEGGMSLTGTAPRMISRLSPEILNQKKKIAMNCYTKSLNETPSPNTHQVQKCLQKLLRALHKDRHHTIQHFRHLLEISFDQVGTPTIEVFF